MSYQGYRLKLNNVIIRDDLIAKGSFSIKRSKRKVGTWTDGTGTDHYVYYGKDRTEINFSIRERNSEEQEGLATIFETKDNINVMYWDDASSTYKTGKFRMDAPMFNHRTTSVSSGLQYKPTKVKLTEY